MAVTREDLKAAEEKLAEELGMAVESFLRADGPGILLNVGGDAFAEFKNKGDAVQSIEFATRVAGRIAR